VSRLPDIQEAFQRFLLTGDADIASLVVGTDRVPVATRLGIYGDGYRSRLIEALQSSFPVLAAALGETDFHTLATGYVDAHPSTFFSIRYFGDRMAQFLAADPHYSQAPILAELARWEWAMAAAFDAADAEPIASSAFAQLAPEQWAELRFQWSPSVQVVELEWNAPQLWKAVTDEAERPDPSLGGEPLSYLVWRRDLQLYFRPLSQEEARVVSAARAGHSFGELCVLLCEHLDEAEASLHAAGFLRGWVESGLIVGAALPSPAE
jgi:hypothetical protein